MRVLMIPSVVGGPNSAGALHFRSICTALARIADVAVVAQYEHQIGPACRVVESKLPESLRRSPFLAWLCHLLNMSFLQLRIVLKSRPDCVYARFGANSLVCILVCSLLRIPTVAEFNGLLNLEASDSKFLLPIGHIRHFSTVIAGATLSLERLVARSSKGIVCVSPTIRDELVRRHNLTGRTQVIENGVDCEVFAPASKVEARKKLGLDLKSCVMLYVGSLVEWQGLDILVEASESVIPERAQSVFLLVGDGPLRQSLEKRVRSLGLSGNFIFTGEVTNRAIPSYISAADVCLAPFKRARNEIAGPSPLKILEYMACGRPVVTTKIPGVSELIVGSNAGLVVLPDHAQELAEAILRLLEDLTFRKTCEKNARSAALRLDWNDRANHLLTFLHLVTSDEGQT